ncbi:High-affinity branched-chain amino acid transport ATP-binding protein LivF [compost metagenome]|uniref:Branched-chain amino acid transport system ATP-binding protein n=1 Tax=Variovorax boronicumulans TaxID=436515 RepID=A0AAW8E225_9BURK|nr:MULTISPECIES: ABC transporter ATP-binding protein [Variovorax]MDP9880591.1 branched-chain amino acid transport system ATP-binding protein [Variovorax boronicumulans]MDP9910325.1 branched-chain amino acid transport system ATP-binding protein [Variovorax boronicumulans]MDP9916951.1 branched-chain amino acid transport system ATP-binding protein [Variovorax boronicumulans]MDP9925878.1 branched-chain amino acid transport system ATP-binding protein [Variovorax boronicumulans]OEZ27589.1 ABC transp
MSNILEVEGLHAHYGKSHVLQGVSLTVGEAELVTLLGRNGAGKSTTLKSIAGAVTPTKGRVRFQGADIAGQPPHRIATRGVCLVPEHRGIFKLLTVEENLLLGLRRDSPWQLADIYRIFPRLKERRRNGGGQLSGGEQQMLAIGRALMNHPRLLILDEPVEGLAPVIVEEIVAQLKTIKAAGVAILLVEQNLEVCVQLADRHYIVEQGVIVHEAGNAAFMADHDVKDRYLGVGLA